MKIIALSAFPFDSNVHFQAQHNRISQALANLQEPAIGVSRISHSVWLVDVDHPPALQFMMYFIARRDESNLEMKAYAFAAGADAS